MLLPHKRRIFLSFCILADGLVLEYRSCAAQATERPTCKKEIKERQINVDEVFYEQI